MFDVSIQLTRYSQAVDFGGQFEMMRHVFVGDQSHCRHTLKCLQMWECMADVFSEGMMSRLRVSVENAVKEV